MGAMVCVLTQDDWKRTFILIGKTGLVCRSTQHVEDEHHFLFDCPAYSSLRASHASLFQQACKVAGVVCRCNTICCGCGQMPAPMHTWKPCPKKPLSFRSCWTRKLQSMRFHGTRCLLHALHHLRAGPRSSLSDTPRTCLVHCSLYAL